jgi:formate-dependent phosphoribosylglycinamide formyltransferase (GAR transformylase)
MKTKLIALAAIVVVLFALGVRVIHPENGLQSAMGSAKSSLVVYKHSGEYGVGSKVIVEETVDVDTRIAFVRVKQADVLGKLIVVVPFFGTILGFVGL